LPTHDNRSATNDWERFTTIEEAERAVAATRCALAEKRSKEKDKHPQRPPQLKPRYSAAAE
jgi:hypothetical protein